MSKIQNMMTQIERINAEINEASPDYRIFYFQCENRDIIFKALNESEELQYRIDERLAEEYQNESKSSQDVPPISFKEWLDEQGKIEVWGGAPQGD